MALEVNMRPPSGLSMDMFNYANDINLYQQWANVMVNNEFAKSIHASIIARMPADATTRNIDIHMKRSLMLAVIP